MEVPLKVGITWTWKRITSWLGFREGKTCVPNFTKVKQLKLDWRCGSTSQGLRGDESESKRMISTIKVREPCCSKEHEIVALDGNVTVIKFRIFARYRRVLYFFWQWHDYTVLSWLKTWMLSLNSYVTDGTVQTLVLAGFVLFVISRVAKYRRGLQVCVKTRKGVDFKELADRLLIFLFW